MENKIVEILVRLVDESRLEKNEKVEKEILEWFRENQGFIPWVESVKSVKVRE
jgi:hypothetical protein